MSARIGIDYLPAVCHAPGIGRYGRELVRALVRLPETPPLALFEVGGGARTMDGAPLGLEASRAGLVRRLRAPLPRRMVHLLGRLGLGADRMLGGVRLFHRLLPDYPPVSPRALEVMPVPELPPEGSAADARLGARLRGLAGVFVFSDAYAREVVRRHDLDPAKVMRVRVGCEHWLRDLPGGVDDLPAVPRILVLGALRSTRDPLAILEGFVELVGGGREATLHFVGRPGDVAPAFRERLSRLGAIRDSVEWIEDPVEAHMPQIVARSSMLVHLAQDEGTPVTPLEAFAMGVDVVADPLPAFREALGNEALYCTDHAPRTLAEQMERACQRRDDGAARGQRRARSDEFRWEATARETLDGWSRVLNGPP